VPAEAGRWPDGFAETEADRRAAMVLSHLRGITPRRMVALASEEGSAVSTLSAIRRGAAGSEGDRATLAAADPASMQEALAGCGGRFAAAGDPEYPRGLFDLADPPIGVYLRGRAPERDRPAVAIVGARSCTPYGSEVAGALGAGLAATGIVVVSGAARGIDAASHEGALRAEGRTVAVLGCGIDLAYPASSRGLLERIAEAGTILSEYPPGTRAEPFRFPARNRIVAAMSRAVVVIEGAPGSGSNITVEHAHDCGRDVLAVPGPVTGPLSAVPHELIRAGASLVRDAADVLSELGMGAGSGAVAPPDLPESLARVLGSLGGPPEGPESIAQRLGMGLGDALSRLLDLEMRGLVRRVGGRFERTLLAGGPPVAD
jgi:DNA processing protein